MIERKKRKKKRERERKNKTKGSEPEKNRHLIKMDGVLLVYSRSVHVNESEVKGQQEGTEETTAAE